MELSKVNAVLQAKPQLIRVAVNTNDARPSFNEERLLEVRKDDTGRFVLRIDGEDWHGPMRFRQEEAA